MLSESWMARVDIGHLVFKPFEGRVSIISDEYRMVHLPTSSYMP